MNYDYKYGSGWAWEGGGLPIVILIGTNSVGYDT